ncbi:DUF3575 domain-containing protein [Algoriphagus sp. Y33]|uniref:DUF3575 domain-containing protein n=1 Tax=Algoriphagus sp. Y33 TaxID=2772483 RepID=UPI0017827378|nr:DUF3575 domain-containing protein [Algoriphagus sp. Y33]
MKCLLALLLLIFSFSLTHAQDAPVTTNRVEIHTGLLGVWLNKEYRLSDQLAIRTEVGLDAGLWWNTYDSGYIFTPVFTAEPRWYYNLEKRAKKGRTTKGNFGNFFSLKTSFHPDLFIISNYYDKRVPDLSIIPTWGIRRAVSRQFIFETGIGLGYIHYFQKSYGYTSNEGELAANLHIRFGYRL